MTDLQRHIAAVAEKPFDKVAALALADHFQEAAGYSRWTALRKVAAVRKPGRDAKFIAQAARVMRSRTSARRILDSLLVAYSGLSWDDNPRACLIRGWSFPRMMSVGADDFYTPIARVQVSVGARWVLLTHRKLVKEQWADNLRGASHRRK